MIEHSPTPEDDDWDIEKARAKLRPKHDGSKKGRKARQKILADAVDGRSLRATGRTEHLNWKVSPTIKAALAAHVPNRKKSLWLEEAIIAKLRGEGVEIDA